MPVSMPIGFNFRNAGGLVTDGAGENYVRDNGIMPYAASPGWGWTNDSSVDSTNRDDTVDRRLAGTCYIPNSASPANGEFRVDTGAGTFNIALAMGDKTDITGPFRIQFFDGADATAILTVTGAVLSSSAGEWYDATGVRRDGSAAWVANNAKAQVTLVNSYLRFRIGGNGASGETLLSHVGIEQVGGGAPAGDTQRLGRGIARGIARGIFRRSLEWARSPSGLLIPA